MQALGTSLDTRRNQEVMLTFKMGVMKTSRESALLVWAGHRAEEGPGRDQPGASENCRESGGQRGSRAEGGGGERGTQTPGWGTSTSRNYKRFRNLPALHEIKTCVD